jgi:predicted DNA-binding transcriptional regulator AlpA
MRDPDPGLPPLTKRIRAITDPHELERWYGALMRAAAVALVRMMLFGRPAVPAVTTAASDRMLKATEASQLFGVSRSWLYEHGERLGFARRPEGIRGVRFSEKELRRWAEGRRE